MAIGIPTTHVQRHLPQPRLIPQTSSTAQKRWRKNATDLSSTRCILTHDFSTSTTLKTTYPGSNVAVAAAASSARSTNTAPLHSSAVLNVESARKRQARLTRQKNLAKRLELSKQASSTRPHVVLGTISSSTSNDDDAWASCDLARVLVRPDEPTAEPIHIPEANADVNLPPTLAFGIRAREQRMLFAHLPLLTADMNTRRELHGSSVNAEDMAAHHERALAESVKQANALARVVDLRNANAAGVAFENRRRVVEAFSEPGKPNDTGRTEVQGAVFFVCFFRSSVVAE